MERTVLFDNHDLELINEDLEEKLKQFQCNHCGNCFKGLPCPQDEKLFKFWKEYYESKGITR